MQPTIYFISTCLLLAAAFITFRVFVRRDYRRTGKLTLFSAYLQWLVFSAWFVLAWLYMTSNPASPSPEVSVILQTIGTILAIIGLGGMFTTMAWFGMRRASGLERNVLIQSGLYRLTRNPQLVLGGVAAIGYVIGWPSWQALGWVLLFAIIAHMMVITEEEHLRKAYGEEYRQYCERVPRYLGFPRRT